MALAVYQRCASFIAANSEYLSRADHALLEPGDGDFSLAAWMCRTDAATDGPQVGKYNASGNQRSYLLFYSHSSGGVRSAVSSLGTGASTSGITDTTEGAWAVGEWHLAVLTYNAGTDALTISVDGQTRDTGSHAGGAFDSTAVFAIGMRDGGVTYLSGLVGPVALWIGRQLSEADEDTLYNAGVPLAYAELSAAMKVNLTAYWELDEFSSGLAPVTRVDSHTNGLDLTDTNTVRSAEGILVTPSAGGGGSCFGGLIVR